MGQRKDLQKILIPILILTHNGNTCLPLTDATRVGRSVPPPGTLVPGLTLRLPAEGRADAHGSLHLGPVLVTSPGSLCTAEGKTNASPLPSPASASSLLNNKEQRCVAHCWEITGGIKEDPR